MNSKKKIDNDESGHQKAGKRMPFAVEGCEMVVSELETTKSMRTAD